MTQELKDKLSQYFGLKYGITLLDSDFENIAKITQPSKNNDLLGIGDVRLPCFQEVWKKWCGLKTYEGFDKWLHEA